MSKKIYCKNQLGTILDCQKIDRNLFKLVKILNQIGSLYNSSEQYNAAVDQIFQQHSINSKNSLMLRSVVDIVRKSNSIYPLCIAQAIQFIWKGAFITKQFGMPQQQLGYILKNKLIGMKNQLCDIIVALAEHVDRAASLKETQIGKVVEARKQLLRLGQISQSIKKVWKKINEEEHPKLKQEQQKNNWISLFKMNIQQRQLKLLKDYVRKIILRVDLHLFKSSIMFIELIKHDYCLVYFQQCYTPFIVNIRQLISAIGQQLFNKAVYLLKDKCTGMMQAMSSAVKMFVMCHKCAFIIHKEQAVSQKWFQCQNKAREADPNFLPYTYQQILLYSNFNALYNIYKTFKNENGNEDFKNYTHTFASVHSPVCGRWICSGCNQKNEIIIEQRNKKIDKQKNQGKQQIDIETQQKINKEKECQFCSHICNCERCKRIDDFNKCLALYDSFGGSFEQLKKQLLFIRWKNCKADMAKSHYKQRQENDSKGNQINQFGIKIKERGRPRGRPRGSGRGSSKVQQKRQKIQQKQGNTSFRAGRAWVRYDNEEQETPKNDVIKQKPKKIFAQDQEENQNQNKQKIRDSKRREKQLLKQQYEQNIRAVSQKMQEQGDKDDLNLRNPSSCSDQESDQSSSVQSNLFYPGLQSFFNTIVEEQRVKQENIQFGVKQENIEPQKMDEEPIQNETAT